MYRLGENVMQQTQEQPAGSLAGNMQAVIEAFRAKRAAQMAATARPPVQLHQAPVPTACLLTVDQVISRPRENSTGWSYVATEAEAQAAREGIYARWPAMPFQTSVSLSHDRGAWRVSWRVYNAD